MDWAARLFRSDAGGRGKFWRFDLALGRLREVAEYEYIPLLPNLASRKHSHCSIEKQPTVAAAQHRHILNAVTVTAYLQLSTRFPKSTQLE
jgi:hypothetical protein